MTRTHIRALATAALAAGSLLLATAAYATVTNPANNPHRIEVLGDDGNTYVDGQDTLPGYDDIACTFIPGAWFDFENNKVHYADGQSIPWTEWDRIAGYSTWVDEQNAAAAAAAAAAAPATSGSTTSGSTAKPASGGSTATGTDSTVVSSDGSTTALTPSPTASPSPSSEPEVSESAAAHETVDSGTTATSAQGVSSSAQSTAGRGILIALFAAGVLAYVAYEIVRRRPQRETAS